MSDLINRADAIEAVMKHKMPFSIQQEVARKIDALPSADAYTEQQVRDAFNSGYSCGMEQTKEAPSADAVQGWNNHEVACMLAELFGDTCACNYNGIDEWLPLVCDCEDICPNTVGVACWEQFMKHYKEHKGGDDE